MKKIKIDMGVVAGLLSVAAGVVKVAEFLFEGKIAEYEKKQLTSEIKADILSELKHKDN